MPFPSFSFFLQGKAMDFTSTTKTNTNMAFSQQTKHGLSTTKILREAIKLPTKSTTLILPILLLSFLASSILFTFAYLATNPVTADLTANSLAIASLDPKSPEYASIQSAILNDLKELLGIKSIFIVFAFIISSLITISTINAFAATFNSKLLTFTDLLCRVRRGLKGPMITMLYVKLLTLGYLFLLCSLIGIFVLTGPGWAVLIASVVILGVAGLVLYLYLAMLWSVSMVISVVEEGCYGLQAISKAGEIVRDRKKQGVVLVFVEFVIMAVVYGIYNVAKLHASPCLASQMGIGIVYVAVGVLASVFELAVSMVFYRDCRRSEEGEVMAIEEGFMYASVPTAAYGEL